VQPLMMWGIPDARENCWVSRARATAQTRVPFLALKTVKRKRWMEGNQNVPPTRKTVSFDVATSRLE
jgi:hypothetical protein